MVTETTTGKRTGTRHNPESGTGLVHMDFGLEGPQTGTDKDRNIPPPLEDTDIVRQPDIRRKERK